MNQRNRTTSSQRSGARKQWRSLEGHSPSADYLEAQRQEFPEGTSEPPAESQGISRRAFLGTLGATGALAGVGLQGCVRKPKQYILPYSQRPEDLLPGEARYFATNIFTGGDFQSLLVESHDNRPTKVEGNPRDAATLGATSAWAQAEVLRLYDVDRLHRATVDGTDVGPSDLDAKLAEIREQLGDGSGFGVVFSDIPSPTFRAQLAALKAAFPQAQLFRYAASGAGNARAAMEELGDASATPRFSLADAEVVVSLDADFLSTEQNAVANARGFSAARRVESVDDGMNRLYAIEPGFTATGMNADNHLALPASQVGQFARALAAELGLDGVGDASAPAGAEAWAQAIANDLTSRRGKGVVIVGERQPAWVHALAYAINERIGAIGQTVAYLSQEDDVEAGTIAEFAAAIADGSITKVLSLGVNPVHGAPGDLELSERYASLELAVALSFHKDATAEASNIVIPEAHQFEAWGDLRDADGRRGIQQPLIAPLYEARSAIEVIDALINDEPRDGHDIVRQTWRADSDGIDFERSWNQWLHDGAASQRSAPNATLSSSAATRMAAAGETLAAPTSSNPELVFGVSPTIGDGTFVNNGWLQELPHPVTKLTWDNAAVMSYNTAEALGIDWRSALSKGRYHGTMLEITVDGRSITIPSFVQPGVADNVIMLEVGYGQSTGSVAQGAGFNVAPIQVSAHAGIGVGATVTKSGGDYLLASTQDHWSLVPSEHDDWPAMVQSSQEAFSRPLLREATMDEYRANPDFVEDDELMSAEKIRSLWTEPNPTSGQQWGMAVDLNTCIGCGACTIACQAENTIPVVGKERVLEGREMHWIRIDRYFVGDVAAPEVAVQPVACMQCETAPCEQVCPVAATVHSPSGLNDMVYNRCIGTRYCGNNCPYKVRRFNFFNFQKWNRQDNPLVRMQRNPNVTPRFRGVMEKCTYCVQRINEARIEAKVDGNGVIPDGGVRVACQQACPADGIAFGDINDPNSAVSKLKSSERDYAMLSYLNTKPRTTYLAKLRNPNPELV